MTTLGHPRSSTCSPQSLKTVQHQASQPWALLSASASESLGEWPQWPNFLPSPPNPTPVRQSPKRVTSQITPSVTPSPLPPPLLPSSHSLLRDIRSGAPGPHLSVHQHLPLHRPRSRIAPSFPATSYSISGLSAPSSFLCAFLASLCPPLCLLRAARHA